MPWRLQSELTVPDKIVAGLCYPTFGVAGLLYTIFGRPGAQLQQFRFHFIQSIVLWIVGTLLSWCLAPLLQLFLGLCTAIMPATAVSSINTGLFYVFNIVQIAFYLLLAYGAIWAFLGKYAEVPFISNVVRQNLR